ncbi:hypothetical protein [Streptomyces sp. NBC_01445]|nr:hypothetical protein [Streptomyces sp. NBC_01445]WSE10186.1 hypothetical protein OG574_46895 [Streptomyces sp. NBC_01445]
MTRVPSQRRRSRVDVPLGQDVAAREGGGPGTAPQLAVPDHHFLAWD